MRSTDRPLVVGLPSPEDVGVPAWAALHIGGETLLAHEPDADVALWSRETLAYLRLRP